MRILFYLNYDLFGMVVAQQLLPVLREDYQLGAVLSTRRRVFHASGSIQQLLTVVDNDLIQELWPDFSGRVSYLCGGTDPNTSGMARSSNKSVHLTSNIDSDDTVEFIRLFSPDLSIIGRFNQILKAEHIAIPRLGTMNCHTGPLPGYAGLAPVLRQILNREERIGYTFHWVDEGIDTGPIIKTGWIEDDAKKSLYGMTLDIYNQACPEYISIIHSVINGAYLRSANQDIKIRNYKSVPSDDDYRELIEMDRNIFDSSDFCKILSNYIR